MEMQATTGVPLCKVASFMWDTDRLAVNVLTPFLLKFLYVLLGMLFQVKISIGQFRELFDVS